jgi:hypothetical protein
VASYSLLETLFTRDVLAGPVKPAAGVWVRDLNEMSRDLKGQRITPVQWQAKVQELFDRDRWEKKLSLGPCCL